MSKASVLYLLVLAGCASAPGYRAPEVALPAAFRETRDTVVEVPVDSGVAARTATWSELRDTTLTRLMNEVARSNLDVVAAEARVRGARSTGGRLARAAVSFWVNFLTQ